MRLGQSLPSGPCMVNTQAPPTRKSNAVVVVVKPPGPHHFPTCAGSVHTFQTISRGASSVRVVMMVASPSGAIALAFAAAMFLLLGLQVFEIVVETVEARVPQLAIFLEPAVDRFQRIG